MFFELCISLIDKLFMLASDSTLCFDRKVALVCYHHDQLALTSSGHPIFDQRSPLLLLNGNTISSQKEVIQIYRKPKRTTFILKARKSVFLNGEANYSCAVVYADGSMEESEPVTVTAVTFNSLVATKEASNKGTVCVRICSVHKYVHNNYVLYMHDQCIV